MKYGRRCVSMNKEHSAPCPRRAYLKKLLLACTFLILGFEARTSQLAFIVLDPATWVPGRLSSAWQIKVNHGKPDISVCADEDHSCLHLKSVKSSFGLERHVDVDPAQLPYLTWRW